MTLTFYGRNFESGELSNTSMYQLISNSTDNVLVKVIRTHLMFYNNPVFTNLTAKLYWSDSNVSALSPTIILATSTTTYNASDIYTDDYAIADLYFEFADVSLGKNKDYALVLSADTYSPTTTSFITWMQDWPDPINTGYTASSSNQGSAPFRISVIGETF
jgi:hypothetical protein